MRYLLNLIYLAAIFIASPWLIYQAICKGKYREGYAEKFLGRVPHRNSNRPCLWLHAVSVGEVNLLAPLIERIASEKPDCQCVLSTTTMTGMALARKKYPQLVVFYCPLDFSWAVDEAMQRIRPNVLVLTELELWPNLIQTAQASGASVAVINGRLSERSFRGYRRIRPIVARLLQRIDVLAVQNDSFAARFLELGASIESIQVTGSMKYDGAVTDRQNPTSVRLARLARFSNDDRVFLAGSTQEPEESLAVETFAKLSTDWPRLRLVLVPRHPDRFDRVAQQLDASGFRWQRRTTLEHESAKPDCRILLVDVVGELGAWWGTADIAFVGGSLGNRGGQNMIEPAAYGAAVCFGPNTWNFHDVVTAMLARQAASVVHDGSELTAFVRRCLEEPGFAAEQGTQSKTLVASQLGATERTFQRLAKLLAKRHPLSNRRAA